MPPFECQSVAARAIASNIPLHPKAGFDCEEGDCPGQKSNGQRQPCRRQNCGMCCSVSAAFGAAMMAGFFLVGPFIMHIKFASEVTPHNHSQSIENFMIPNARPLAGRRRPGAIIRRPPFEPSMPVPSSIRPGAGGSNKHFEVAQIGAEVKELEKVFAEQEMHAGHSKSLEAHEGKNGATGEPTPGNALAQLIACFLVVIGVVGFLLYSRITRHVVRSSVPLSRSRLAATTMSANPNPMGFGKLVKKKKMSANDTPEAESAEDSTGMSGAAEDIAAELETKLAKLEEAVAREDIEAVAALQAELDALMPELKAEEVTEEAAVAAVAVEAALKAGPEVMEDMYASLTQPSSRRGQLMQEREHIKALAADDLALRSLFVHWTREFGDEAFKKLDKCSREAARDDFSKLESLIEEYPDWVEPVYQLATFRFKAGDFAQSAALCHKTLRQKPWHFGAAILVVSCYDRLGETQKVKELGEDLMPQPGPGRKQWVERMVEEINSKLEALDGITDERS